MDFMNSFPGSWSLVRKNLPSLIGAGVGAVAGSFAAGRRAYKEIQKDNQQSRLLTWSSRSKMPIPSVRRVGGMRRRVVRRPYRRIRYSKGMAPLSTKRLVRSTAINSLTQSASTSAYFSANISLNQVQTSDLTAIYRLFRIRKVVVHVIPRVDTANSGVASNFQAFFAAACDPESTATPTSHQQITAYDNSHQKWVTSGDRFTYTFYPKVTNTVDVSGTATAVGSYAINPFLRLDATGITVPHLSMKLGMSTSTATTLVYDWYYDIHFDVRGIA